MEEVVLQAKSRQVIGKQVRSLRRAGLLPAIIYGRGIDPLPITLYFREATHVLPSLSTSHLVVVNLEGKPHTTLVRDKQRHPITGSLLHVDFQEVSMTETLRVTVHITLQGEAPAVKNLDGVLVTGQEELEVECLPGDLPDRIVVDVTSLTEIGDSIRVKDIIVPVKVKVLSDPEEMVVVVIAPTLEAEVVEEEISAVEPEVIERGKKEEEE